MEDVTLNKAPTTQAKRKVSIPAKMVLFFNFIAIVLLLLSYLAMFVSPQKFYPLAFLGFAYPIFLLLNLFFVIFWIFFLKKFFILSLIIILIGFNQLRCYINISFPSKNKNTVEHTLSVMSYNVRLFDLYNWRSDKSSYTKDQIMDLLKDKKPSVLCIQEYYNGLAINMDFAKLITSALDCKYSSVEFIKKEGKELPFGFAVFSKYPIINSERIPYDNSTTNFMQVCDILMENDTIRVINTHLESIRFGKDDYSFVSDITSKKSTTTNKEIKEKSRAIMAKMKRAYVKRSAQVKNLVEYSKDSPYPVIVAADFNDTPVSYAHRQITNILSDGFIESGNGLGYTYVHSLFFLRIDYIFHSADFHSIDYKIIRKAYSDHYPSISTLGLIKKKE